MRLKIDHLSLADPKALRYVLHTSGYHFPKGREVDQNIKLVLGTGILCAPSTWIVILFHSHYDHSFAVGTDHQRQRKIMTPAFHAPQLRTFLPLFLDVALKVGQPR